jgi:flagellar biosynthesis protein FlhF
VNVKRYFARTNREAMAMLRAELGPDAVVIRNRAVAGGVEVLAMDGREEVHALAADPAPTPSSEPAQEPPVRGSRDAGRREAARAGPARGDAAVPEMSTLSFQQYVRDRLAQKAAPAGAEPLGDLDGLAMPSPRSQAVRGEQAAAEARRFEPPEALPPLQAVQPSQPQHAVQPSQSQAAVQSKPMAAPAAAASLAASVPAGEAQERLLSELRDMRRFISEQLSSIAWSEGMRRNPLQTRLLQQLLSAGFSPSLARAVVARLPSDFGEAQADAWARQALAHNLHCETGSALFEQGGIFALVGPTGVGKTTSTAKIAARFALRHGAQSVGLVTVDAYRIGGQDQLRSFGRMLGVPVHVAHDPATLADFLHLYMNKKLVLIDTAGIGQRDERVEELLASLSSTVVRKLVVLNAAAQAETLEDVAKAYRAGQAAGVVISKVDEAVKLGGVLDCAIRHKLRIVGVANGQRVPEDWEAPDPARLVASALQAASAPAFEIDETALSLMVQPVWGAAHGASRHGGARA